MAKKRKEKIPSVYWLLVMKNGFGMWRNLTCAISRLDNLVFYQLSRRIKNHQWHWSSENITKPQTAPFNNKGRSCCCSLVVNCYFFATSCFEWKSVFCRAYKTRHTHTLLFTCKHGQDKIKMKKKNKLSKSPKFRHKIRTIFLLSKCKMKYSESCVLTAADVLPTDTTQKRD